METLTIEFTDPKLLAGIWKMASKKGVSLETQIRHNLVQGMAPLQVLFLKGEKLLPKLLIIVKKLFLTI